MSAALVVFLYALAVAWSVPPLLAPLTGHGISARLGPAAWLTAMASALACAGAAVALLISAAAAGWPGFAEAVCRSVTGRACTAVVYRSALFELPLGAAAPVAALTAAALAWRYSRGSGEPGSAPGFTPRRPGSPAGGCRCGRTVKG